MAEDANAKKPPAEPAPADKNAVPVKSGTDKTPSKNNPGASSN